MKELSIEEKAYDGNYKAYTELINRLEDVKEAIKKQNYGIAMDILFKPYPEFQITTHSELKESEDEEVRKEIVTYLKSVIANKGYRDKIIESWIAWLEKQGKQNPAWSEEDERIYKVVLELIDSYSKGTIGGCIIPPNVERYAKWFKSLKDRVQPQPKQEWSEQEQVRINRIVACLENLNVADNDILLKDVDWLKSLKDRYTWKPSEEQMKALEDSIEFLGCTKKVREDLKSLYEQLKKLREE